MAFEEAIDMIKDGDEFRAARTEWKKEYRQAAAIEGQLRGMGYEGAQVERAVKPLRERAEQLSEAMRSYAREKYRVRRMLAPPPQPIYMPPMSPAKMRDTLMDLLAEELVELALAQAMASTTATARRSHAVEDT